MDTKSTVTGAITGIVLTAVIALAVPPSENPEYVDTKSLKGEEQVIKVTRTVCEPFEYSATKSEMIQYANDIQTMIDTQPIDPRRIDILEQYKTRFIEDSANVDTKS